MNIKNIFCFLLLWVTLGAYAQTAPVKPTLSLGDQAPELAVFQWIKGTPVKGFEKGRVYVVECWATWCGPCIAAMPHLSDLARQYRDKVTVIGVSVWESSSKPVPDAAAIQRFVDGKGKDMDYTVAMDDPAKNRFADTWLRAAGLNGIPATFVIDRESKIAWMGHPLKVDSILKLIVETPDKYDLSRTKDQYNKDQIQLAKRQAAQSVLGYSLSRNHGIAWQQAQKLIKEDPKFESENFWIVVRAYLNFNTSLAQTYVEGKSKDNTFLKALGYENTEAGGGQKLLDIFASLVAQEPGFPPSMYYMAAERLTKAMQKTPNNYMTLSVLAQAFANLNEPEKAIQIQEKVITLFRNDTSKAKEEAEKDMIAKAGERLTKKLEEYKTLKEKKDILLQSLSLN